MTTGHTSSAQQRSFSFAAKAAAFRSTLFAIALFAPTPASADSDWAMDIIRESNRAEGRVARQSTRVASLGNTSVSDSEDTPRRSSSRRAAISEEDRPQARRTRAASRPAASRQAARAPGYAHAR